VPSIASLDALHRTIAEFVVIDLDLVIEPPALAAARQSLDSSGLLLLGETHGVRENPLLIRALMKAFGLTSLALEWPEDLTPMIRAFLASGTLASHPWLWGGDGRITAGHLAVLADRAAAHDPPPRPKSPSSRLMRAFAERAWPAARVSAGTRASAVRPGPT
jgi:hypothetical protein